ncbi:MAG: methyltransferase domain-containing protein [Comamonas sp.]
MASNSMERQIIGMRQWLQTAPGAYALDWAQRQADQAVADVFGYHAVQLGLPPLDGLRANRMPGRWLAALDADEAGDAARLGRSAALVCDSGALPLESASIDLLLLPFTLDLSGDPHQTLREVERVLVPEGRVLFIGMNPASLWGLRQWRAHLYRRMGMGQLYLPGEGQFIAPWRLRDWLGLLEFEVDGNAFGCYRPSLRTAAWLQHYGWMDDLGARSWPIFGAVYAVMATKRIRGMRLIGPAWKNKPTLGGKALPLARCESRMHETR